MSVGVCLYVCCTTPPKLLGIRGWNLVSICIEYPWMYLTMCPEGNLKVKVTARSKVKLTFIAISRSIFYLEQKCKIGVWL